jgi:hypothetical protein
MEAGKYKAKAHDFRIGRAGTGTYQIGVSFCTSNNNEFITWYGALTEEALEITVKALRAMGWRGNDLSALGIDDIQKEVSIDVQVSDRGNLFVAWVNDGYGVAMKDVLKENELRAFASGMKSRIAQIQSGGSTKKKTQQQTQQQTARAIEPLEAPNDDDVPF